MNAAQKRPNQYTKGTIVVYRIRNIVTGECYVVSSFWVEERFTEHRRAIETRSSPCMRLRKASQRYGPDDFAFEILETFDHPDDLVEVENRWITKLDSHRSGYNVNPRAGRKPFISAPKTRTHLASSTR